MIYRLLYKLLNDSPEVVNRVATRIYAERIPQDLVIKEGDEYIILRMLSGTPEYGLDGECNCTNSVMQVDCHAKSPTKARSLYQRVRNRLSGFSGDVLALNDDGVEETVNVSECRVLRPGMIVSEPQDASDNWSFNCSTDFDIFYSQSVPTLT